MASIVELNNQLLQSNYYLERNITQYYDKQNDVLHFSLFDSSQDILPYTIILANEIYRIKDEESYIVNYMDYIAYRRYDNYNFTPWLMSLNEISDPYEINNFTEFLLVDERQITNFITTNVRILPDKYLQINEELYFEDIDLQYIDLRFFVSSYSLSLQFNSYIRPSGVSDNDIFNFVRTLY